MAERICPITSKPCSENCSPASECAKEVRAQQIAVNSHILLSKEASREFRKRLANEDSRVKARALEIIIQQNF